jgi:hypothetical protein
MCVIGDAQCNVIVLGEDQTRATLLRCAANATPVVVTITSVKKIVHDEQRLFPLTLNVLKPTLKREESSG